MKPMKAIITGGELFNKGAQSMTYITVSELRERFGENIEIVLSSKADMKRSDEEKAIYKFGFDTVFNERAVWYLAGGFYKLLAKIKGINLKDVQKLKNILCETDMMIDISGYALSSVWKFHRPFTTLALISACKNCNCGYFVMPQSIGPFNYKGIERQMFNMAAKKSFKDAKIIYAREEDGIKALEKYKLKNVRKAFDLVLSNTHINKEYIFNQEPEMNIPEIENNSVGIIPNMKNFKHGNKADVLGCYKNIIDKLLISNKNVYLLTHSAEDITICENIKEMFSDTDNVRIINAELSCFEYDEIVDKFDFLIASRFHSIVHAYRKYVPCVAIGWAVKYHELLRFFGQEDYILDVRGNLDNKKAVLAVEKMINAFKNESEKIRQGMEEVRKENAFDILGRKETKEYPSKSVQKVANEGLCSACGVCVGICPKNAVKLEKNNGTYMAHVGKECTNCGLCRDMCTALDTNVSKLYQKAGQNVPENKLTGNVVKCYTVSAKDKQILKNSTSGGFICATVKYLLENKIYDCAFLVKGYNYDSILKAQRVIEFEPDVAKSRYLSVSMENLVKEILEKKDEKIIICAVGCAVEAITNVIDRYKLNRDNYLILGLFCDNVQSYKVMDYFKTLKKGKIKELYFRDKTVAIWPGNVRINYENSKTEYFPAHIRMDAKKYYKLKRCFVCFDKLNVFSDISVGDNYTKENEIKGGSNSIIVRTPKGNEAFEEVKELFDVYETTAEKICTSQSMEARKENIANASVVSQKQSVTVYNDMETQVTAKHIDSYINSVGETKKTLKEIKKEIKAKQTKRMVKKIKRKLGIR